MDAELVGSSLFIAIFLFLLFYFLLRFFLNKKIISFWDPLHFGSILTSFALAGIGVYIFKENSTPTSLAIISFVYIAFFIGALMAQAPKQHNVIELTATQLQQKILVFSILVITISNIVLNQLLGSVGLAEGTESRANLGNVIASPTLMLFSMSLNGLPVLLFYLSKFKKVKIIAAICMIIIAISSLLGGSKSALFGIITWIICGLFLLELNIKIARKNNFAITTPNESKKYQQLKKIFYLITLSTIILLPFWLMAIKAGEHFEESIMIFLNRLFLGYDGFIWLFSFDIDVGQLQTKLSLIDFWFYPYVKHIQQAPEFQTAGQYAVYLALKDLESSRLGLNPNSNLVLELIFTQNFLSSIFLAFFLGYLMFYVRSKILSHPTLGLFKLSFFYIFVTSSNFLMGPLSFLQDGSFYMDGFVKVLLLTSAVWLVSIILSRQKKLVL